MTSRRGMTLYEIVLSLAILLGSMAVMAKMVATGSRAATQAQLRTEAAILCEAQLGEVVAGVQPMTAVSGSSLADPASPTNALKNWTWSLEVTNGPHNDLISLRVTVNHKTDEGKVDATSTLVRFVRDPAVYEAAAAQKAANENETQSGE